MQDPIAQPKDLGDTRDPGDNSAAVQQQQYEGIQKGVELDMQQNTGHDAQGDGSVASTQM